MLNKAKSIAKETKYFTITLEVLEFEKLIELQYITRSIANRAETLSKEVNETAEIVQSAHILSNLWFISTLWLG